MQDSGGWVLTPLTPQKRGEHNEPFQGVGTCAALLRILARFRACAAPPSLRGAGGLVHSTPTPGEHQSCIPTATARVGILDGSPPAAVGRNLTAARPPHTWSCTTLGLCRHRAPSVTTSGSLHQLHNGTVIDSAEAVRDSLPVGPHQIEESCGGRPQLARPHQGNLLSDNDLPQRIDSRHGTGTPLVSVYCQ